MKVIDELVRDGMKSMQYLGHSFKNQKVMHTYPHIHALGCGIARITLITLSINHSDRDSVNKS